MSVRPRGIITIAPEFSRQGLKEAIYEFVKIRTDRKQTAPSKVIARSFMLSASKTREYLLELKGEGRLDVDSEGWYTTCRFLNEKIGQ